MNGSCCWGWPRAGGMRRRWRSWARSAVSKSACARLNRKERLMSTLATVTRRLEQLEHRAPPSPQSVPFMSRPLSAQELAAVLNALLEIESINRPAHLSLTESLRAQQGSRLAQALLLAVEQCGLDGPTAAEPIGKETQDGDAEYPAP